jgi:hypothetical protein
MRTALKKLNSHFIGTKLQDTSSKNCSDNREANGDFREAAAIIGRQKGGLYSMSIGAAKWGNLTGMKPQ